MFCKIFTAAKTFLDVFKIKHLQNVLQSWEVDGSKTFLQMLYFYPRDVIPSLQLGTGKTVGWLVGKSCLSRVACLSACGRGPSGPTVRKRLSCRA